MSAELRIAECGVIVKFDDHLILVFPVSSPGHITCNNVSFHITATACHKVQFDVFTQSCLSKSLQ